MIYIPTTVVKREADMFSDAVVAYNGHLCVYWVVRRIIVLVSSLQTNEVI